MQAVTLRRLMVFGVCLLGVGALYLVPSMARAPDRIGGAPLTDETPSVRSTSSTPSPSSVPPARATVTTTTTTFVEPPSQSERTSEPAPDPTTETEDPISTPNPIETRVPQSEPTSSRPVSTPFVAGPAQDETAPDQVTALESRPTADQLRLVWAPGTDDVGVIRYRVWLDGYEVQTTDETAATLDWFNDDSAQHVVQVRAVDAAGNESELPATLLVTRPTPAPSPTPEPTATPTPSPSARESPSPSQTPSTDDGGKP